MANWNLPTITSGYINFVTEMNAKFTDAATLQFGSPINFPLQTIRFERAINVFQEWLGPASGWQNKILGIAGGGTGAATVGDIRVNLGLGSMSTQNNNAVNITGGIISGVSLDITATTGILPLARGGTGASLALGYAGSVLMSNGTQTQYMSGGNITEINASNITQGTLPIARIPGVVLTTANNIFSGANTFVNNAINIQSNLPTFFFTDVDDSIGNIYSRMSVNNRTFLFQLLGNDATTVISTPLTASDYGIFVAGGSGYIHARGDNLTNLNGSNITTGIVAPARLGSGSPSAATYLRGDGVWATIATGGGEVSPIPSGMIAIFSTGCPAGWTRVTGMDNRFILGSPSWGLTGGANTHSHTFDVTSGNNGGHSHSFGGNFGGSGSAQGGIGGSTFGGSADSGSDAGNSFQASIKDHFHNFNIQVNIPVNVTTNVSGDTSGVGDHAHRVAGGTSSGDNIPPYFSVVFCMKN